MSSPQTQHTLSDISLLCTHIAGILVAGSHRLTRYRFVQVEISCSISAKVTIRALSEGFGTPVRAPT